MNKEVTGNREFLDEILSGAQKEAEELISQAEKRGDARKKAARTQEDALLREAEAQLEKERVYREKLADQKISSEVRRKELQLRDRFMSDALAQAKEKLSALTQTDEYDAVLADWVLEAVMGLNAPRVEVNGRKRERDIMTAKWLKGQEERIRKEFGREVDLSLSEEAPLIAAGVVAREKGGRLVFNNQIDTRILRKQSDLRKVIYEELFKD